MSMLPPENFITAALAAVYSIGFVIHNETNLDFRKDIQSHLYSTSGVQATFVRGNGKQILGQFRSLSMYLFEDKHASTNPFLHGGLGLTLAPIPDDEDMPKEFGEDWVTKNVESIWVPLQPPYRGCTSSERLTKDATCTAYDRQSADIVNFKIHFPFIEEAIAAYMRQALASERINSILIEEDGHIIKLPGLFWRTSKSEATLLNDHPIIAEIEGKKHLGYIYVDFNDLRSAWEGAYKRDRTTSSPARIVQDIDPSPYIAFMLRASTHFGLVEGNMPDGSRLTKNEIEHWLDRNWPASLGEKSQTLLSNMATFIRHPAAGRGGNVKLSLPAPKPGKLKAESSGAKI